MYSDIITIVILTKCATLSLFDSNGFKKNLNRAGQSVKKETNLRCHAHTHTLYFFHCIYGRSCNVLATLTKPQTANSTRSSLASKRKCVYTVNWMLRVDNAITHTDDFFFGSSRLEKKSDKLSKETKGYLDSIRGKAGTKDE